MSRIIQVIEPEKLQEYKIAMQEANAKACIPHCNCENCRQRRREIIIKYQNTGWWK